jgi:type I restriction enzyme R subunit
MARFEQWMAQQGERGRRFTQEQTRWLGLMRDHIATSLGIRIDDFDYAPFAEEGGLGKATQVFGGELRTLMDELNEVLAA